MKRFSVLTAMIITVCLIFSPMDSVGYAMDPLEDEKPSASAMLADFLVVRPLGFVSFVLGTGLFVVSLPFSIPTQSVDDAYEALMLKPARLTFVRPLGAEL